MFTIDFFLFAESLCAAPVNLPEIHVNETGENDLNGRAQFWSKILFNSAPRCDESLVRD
jgi:hypothetical protein